MALKLALTRVLAGWLALAGMASPGFSAEGRQSVEAPAIGVPWPATDGLARSLPTPAEVGPPKPDRFVGIFYFLWLNEVGNKAPQGDHPYDVSRILAADPEALKKPESPLWGGIGRSHYWGEPLYGYYLSTDPWVLRRHVWLLSDAGVDTLIFDTTNAVTYKDVYLRLCEVFAQVRAEGGATPRIAFMLNTEAGKTARQLFEDLYKPGLFRELWFTWQGKPLMICDPKEADPQLREFFTLRKAHWPFEMVNTQNAWHWEAAYAQPYGFTDDPAKPEQVNVSVAQNLRAADGKVTNMSNGDARGRSFHDGNMDTSPGAVNQGHNAAEQWKRAFELNPPFVMVTGWNEWIAGRWGEPKGPITFVDQFSEEYSRDIEPMKGGHADNYYYQMVANIRRYKGAPAVPKPSAPATIRIGGGFDQWRRIAPEFRDHVGEALPRDFGGAAGLRYTNTTGRNDIEVCKVARDREQVYFLAQARAELSPASEPNWMWLLIDADGNPKTGWCGCEFIVNRTSGGQGEAWLEKHKSGFEWEKVAKVPLAVRGRQLHVAVPRESLGLGEGTDLSLNFKWLDNAQQPGEVMDLYLSGDVAPEGRYLYRYEAR